MSERSGTYQIRDGIDLQVDCTVGSHPGVQEISQSCPYFPGEDGVRHPRTLACIESVLDIGYGIVLSDLRPMGPQGN
tara:strand:+ start:517 stop:747 length:231 start_codon:yes stop_codon:yes gene_type:complete